KQGMRLEHDFEVKVARLALTCARASLACQADMLSLPYSFRNTDVQRTFSDPRPSVLPRLGMLQSETADTPLKRIFKVDRYFCMGVLPLQIESLFAILPGMSAPSEQGLEKTAEL